MGSSALHQAQIWEQHAKDLERTVRELGQELALARQENKRLQRAYDKLQDKLNKRSCPHGCDR